MIRKLSTDESFALKHKRFFKETLGVDIDKKEKASLKNVYKHADLYAKEKIFDPKDVEAYRNRYIYPINSQFYDVNSLIKILKYLGFADGEELSFEEYFENIQTSLQNDKVDNQILKC